MSRLSGLKKTFARYDLSDYQNAQRNALDDRNPEVMNALPESVRDSFAHYYDHAEANDWATVYLSRHELDGESLYMVATRTDGSDNYMELFGADGRPLASGERWRTSLGVGTLCSAPAAPSGLRLKGCAHRACARPHTKLRRLKD